MLQNGFLKKTKVCLSDLDLEYIIWTLHSAAFKTYYPVVFGLSVYRGLTTHSFDRIQLRSRSEINIHVHCPPKLPSHSSFYAVLLSKAIIMGMKQSAMVLIFWVHQARYHSILKTLITYL